jgi:hypothetical protein
VYVYFTSIHAMKAEFDRFQLFQSLVRAGAPALLDRALAGAGGRGQPLRLVGHRAHRALRALGALAGGGF